MLRSLLRIVLGLLQVVFNDTVHESVNQVSLNHIRKLMNITNNELNHTSENDVFFVSFWQIVSNERGVSTPGSV